jgi:hypothetical protein
MSSLDASRPSLAWEVGDHYLGAFPALLALPCSWRLCQQASVIVHETDLELPLPGM